MFEKAIQDAGGKIYEVGGTVRDAIMGLQSKDHDLLVTGVPFDILTSVLKPYGTVTLVCRSFGVIKFTSFKDPDTTYDIALPRKEVSTGSGHRDFAVDFDHTLPVEIDLSRRDFTVNAMARELKSGALIDPFNGRADLEKKQIRQVFPDAFKDDPLRMLRAIQFVARFEFSIEPDTFSAMKKHAHLIKTVSGERLVEEMRKLFLAKKPSYGFEIMRESGVLKFILPELYDTIGIQQDKGHDVWRHTMIVLDAAASDPIIDNCGDLELMFAALFHDVGKARTARFVEDQKRVAFFGHQIVSKRIAAKRLGILKATILGVDPDNILTLIENHMFETKSFFSDKAIRRFIAKVGQNLILKLVDLRIADNRGGKYPAGVKGILKLKAKILDELSRKPPFGPKDLAINGTDLMEQGIAAGPKMGIVIKQLVELVLDDPNLNTKDQLSVLAKNIYSEITGDHK